MPPVYILNPLFSGRQLLITLIASRERISRPLYVVTLLIFGGRDEQEIYGLFSIFYVREIVGFSINMYRAQQTHFYIIFINRLNYQK